MEIFEQFQELDNKIKALTDEKKRIAWEVGVPALIEKMKNLGKRILYLREAEEEAGVWATEQLWFWYGDGRYAARLLTLDEVDRLYVVYNSFWDNESSNSGEWGYDDEDMVAEVTRRVSDTLMVEILPELFEDDCVFEIEDEDV